MNPKICRRCKVEKLANEFGKDARRKDGLRSYCKACHAAREVEWQKNNYALFRQRSKEKRARRKAKALLHGLKWRKSHRVQHLANKKLQRAVKDGKLIRPEVCSRCHRIGKTEGHHLDYSKPLEVVWLCSMCHAAQHKPVLFDPINQAKA